MPEDARRHLRPAVHLPWSPESLGRTSSAMPASSPGSENDHQPESTGSPGRREVTYDSVTIHYRAEDEEPMTVSRVTRLADSFFPGSGKRALQVIDDP